MLAGAQRGEQKTTSTPVSVPCAVSTLTAQEDSVFGSYSIYESDADVTIDLNVAGHAKEDIEIEAKGKMLHILSKVSPRNRISRKLNERFTIPSYLDNDDITASCKDGILTVRLPKKNQLKARLIQVD